MKIVEIKKTEMIKFIKSIKSHFRIIDQIMKLPENHERGKKIAEEMNRINFDFDSFVHFELNVPLEKLQTILNKSFHL